jgi:hypothetical protein
VKSSQTEHTAVRGLERATIDLLLRVRGRPATHA